MKKDYNSKKKATIAALSLVAVCLVVGLFYFVGNMGNEPPLPTESKPPIETEVIVPEIKTDVKPESTPTEGNTAADSTDKSTDTDVEKPSDGKPKTPEQATPPTEQPKTEDGKDRTPPPAESGKDHEFTPEDSDKKLEYKPEQTQPDSKPDQPQGGDTRPDGSVYVPGFGWVEDEGENSQGSAPNAGTGKPVGDM